MPTPIPSRLELLINQLIRLADSEILDNQPDANDPPSVASNKESALDYWGSVKEQAEMFYAL
jgi:hypothetical protein